MKLNRINTDLEESDRMKLVENMQDRDKSSVVLSGRRKHSSGIGINHYYCVEV
jgi:hypothetical protein